MTNLSKILFVDDEKNILDAYRRNLPTNINADYCTEPLEAIKMVQENGYEVVVSDISMPKMSGIKFIEKVKEINNEIVTVIVTGYASIDNAVESINKGHVFRFLTKPVDHKLLLKAVEDSLDQYQNIIAKKKLYSTEQIKNEMEAMINSFAKIIEIRDPYTSGHQKSVADLSLKVANTLGWNEDKKQGLYLSAIIHDIGKIYVPAEFLNKPGKLTMTEFSIIKQHPTIGYEILNTVNFKWPIADIISQHHEKIDGSGYPNGLTEDKILEEAQVIAVCDVYDAMISHRPYRAALPQSEVIKYLESIKGKCYKENHVNALFSIIDIQ